MMPCLIPIILPAIAGIATHLLFSIYEPRQPLVPTALSLSEPPIFLYLACRCLSIDTPWSFVPLAYLSFFVAMCASVVLYRLSPAHPLAEFPGPRIAKISKLWAAYLTWTGRQHLYNKKLHDQYGPFVRTGPNELSIADADAVAPVLGSQGLPKGKYYDARQDPTAPRNLIILRGEEHTARRRLWNRGMSGDSLREYEGLISERAHELVERLAGLEGSVDFSKWLSFFSFDFMGDMAFGSGFGMIQDGQDSKGLWKALEDFMYAAAVVSHIPWASCFIQKIPYVARGLTKLRKIGVSCATNRIKSGSKIKDLWYHLTDEAGRERQEPNLANVVADGTVAIVAGADTVATAVICLFYYLLSNRPMLERLRREVDSVYPQGENAMDTSKHANMPYLSACISETLRILPPVPTNGSRRVPSGSGGKLIAGRVVPENTEVYVPAFSLHRSPRYFSPCPDIFWPDRWLSKEHTESFNPNTYIPFSHGPANCVGRNLAKREIMMLSSLLIQTFDMRFEEGFDPSTWEEKLHDHLVLTRAPLPVVLTPRHV
ncbi:Cytochrome P450 superfamily protein [Pleurotus pulmonarius]